MHKEYSMSFVVGLQKKKYGYATSPNGRRFIRNYGRELKNGNGLSLTDLLQSNIFGAQNRALLELSSSAFGDSDNASL